MCFSIFFFKQKTAYEMRISDWSSDVCSSDLLRSTLEGAGYAIDLATDGEDGHYLGSTENYDAAILDLGLPEVDGLTVLDRWRKEGKTTPVQIGRASWRDRVCQYE